MSYRYRADAYLHIACLTLVVFCAFCAGLAIGLRRDAPLPGKADAPAHEALIERGYYDFRRDVESRLGPRESPTFPFIHREGQIWVDAEMIRAGSALRLEWEGQQANFTWSRATSVNTIADNVITITPTYTCFSGSAPVR